MIDFTSALYLGLHHPSWALRQWSQFTTGVPAALASPPDAQVVAKELAALQGCEWGLLGPSTLHLFWDRIRDAGAVALSPSMSTRDYTRSLAGESSERQRVVLRYATLLIMTRKDCGRCSGRVDEAASTSCSNGWFLSRLWKAGTVGCIHGSGSHVRRAIDRGRHAGAGNFWPFART